MRKPTLLTIGLMTLLATATQANQEQLTASIKDARVETAKTAEQLKATLLTLNELTAQKKGDLRPAYTNFCAEIPRTEAAAALTRTRLEWMAGDGQKYFQTWQDSINSIANESLRKNAQKRMNSVKKSYDSVEASLVQAAKKFQPFLSDLTDIQKALATDITAGGVKAIKGTVSSANWNHQYVEKSVQAALKEMDKMVKALSPEAK